MNVLQEKIKNFCDSKDNQNPFSYKLENNIWFYRENEPRKSPIKKYGNSDFVPFLSTKNFKVNN